MSIFLSGDGQRLRPHPVAPTAHSVRKDGKSRGFPSTERPLSPLSEGSGGGAWEVPHPARCFLGREQRCHGPVGLAGHVLRRGELSAPGRDLTAREAEERGGSGRQSPQARPRPARERREGRGSLGGACGDEVLRRRSGTRLCAEGLGGDTRACGNFWGVCLENCNACVRRVRGEARVGGECMGGGLGRGGACVWVA